MNNVNKTLYIPLYGKAYVSQKGIVLSDQKAEEIWSREGFKLKGKSKSKWLAYYMGMRSRVFDDWTRDKVMENQDCVIIHIGCGLDSRVMRVGLNEQMWYDVDFPEVIKERRKYFIESSYYKMIEGDVSKDAWLLSIPKAKKAVVVMEGVSMYLAPRELELLVSRLADHFDSFSLLMDCYTTLAAKMTKIKNPINDVGVTLVYGIDDPKALETHNLSFVKEHEMTPKHLVNELASSERKLFEGLYGGSFSKKLYRLYEYNKY